MANSDHFNFASHGIPAVRLVAGFNEPQSSIKYLLTPEDTREKINLADLRRATHFAALLTAQACQVEQLDLR